MLNALICIIFGRLSPSLSNNVTNANDIDKQHSPQLRCFDKQYLFMKFYEDARGIRYTGKCKYFSFRHLE